MGGNGVAAVQRTSETTSSFGQMRPIEIISYIWFSLFICLPETVNLEG